jgi:1,4-dihydroxy-2-naphthoyl-CoA hydrolase
MSSDQKARIWTKTFTLDDLNAAQRRTASEHLGMRFSAFGDDWLSAQLEVNERTVQPMGILHGGVSVALAETVGSTASYLCIDDASWRAVGVEINANHLRMARSGLVTGTARPLSVGRQLHVWQIDIVNDAGTLICVSRLTMAIISAAKRGLR